MSLDTAYWDWEVAATLSGSGAVGPGALTHCDYRLTGRQLVERYSTLPGPGWRPQPGAMGGRVSPELRRYWGYGDDSRHTYSQEPESGYFELTFTGAGLTAGWPLGVTYSPSSFTSDMVAFWQSGAHRTARSFAGKGQVLDLSRAVGSGFGAQMLIFPTFGRDPLTLSPTGIIGSVFSMIDLITAICERRIHRLREFFPTAAIVVGPNVGIGSGVTWYEGIWRVSEDTPPIFEEPRSSRPRRRRTCSP